MTANLSDTLDFYCASEMKNSKNNDLFRMIESLVEKLGYILEYKICKVNDKKRAEYILYLEVYNRNHEEIEIFDDGTLTAFTTLILVDKKERYKFFSWKDEEFLEDLQRIIDRLSNFVRGDFSRVGTI